jgi:outer membrane murein-binding lipoprotein Lpp
MSVGHMMTSITSKITVNFAVVLATVLLAQCNAWLNSATASVTLPSYLHQLEHYANQGHITLAAEHSASTYS